MYVGVQRAARSLGVSPQTIRRWTAAGFLPCTRTAGGHRRIKQEDVEELAQLIGGSNHLAARHARERELDVLVETSVALAGTLELPDLLREIARRLTGVLECHFCGISTYDAEAGTVTMLADYDNIGRRLPNTEPYSVSRFPCTAAVLTEQRIVVVNVDDRRADPDEVRELRREGDKSLLMVPLVYCGRSIGLLELMDHLRERRYSRQELRLCSAIAGQAAVALHNAQAFSRLYLEGERMAAAAGALQTLARSVPPLVASGDRAAVLEETARLVCELPAVLSCVASTEDGSAGAVPAGGSPPQAARMAGGGHIYVTHDPTGGDLTLTTSVDAVLTWEVAFLEVVTALAAQRLRRVREEKTPKDSAFPSPGSCR